MEIGQVAMVGVMLGGLGAYYYFKVGKHGGIAGYQQKILGLKDGEQLTSQWNAYFDFDQSVGDKVFDAVAGLSTRGKHLYVGITNLGRVVIAQMEAKEPPMSFARGEVVIAPFDGKPKIGSIAGMQGMEKPKIVQLTPANGEPFRLQLAESAADSLVTWARGG